MSLLVSKNTLTFLSNRTGFLQIKFPTMFYHLFKNDTIYLCYVCCSLFYYIDISVLIITTTFYRMAYAKQINNSQLEASSYVKKNIKFEGQSVTTNKQRWKWKMPLSVKMLKSTFHF